MLNGKRWSWREALALALLIVSASVAWSKRIGGGDTFVSLAAGRDTLAGKMGLPDEWSFTTEGRIWLDQNWGSHTTYYVSHRLFGDFGPVAVKWLVLFGLMLLMVRAAHMRGADWAFAALIVSVTILVARSYLDVRPHIFTLLFETALIVVFFQWYKGSAAWAFVATAIIALWANMHGGFIFGLAMTGLWLGVQGFFKIVWPRSRPWGWYHLIVLGVALGVAVLLATFVNPFGWINLTHPLVVEKSNVWLSVQEWHPILDWKALASELKFKQAAGFGSVTEFLVLMVVLIAVLFVWVLIRASRLPDEHGSSGKTDDAGRRRDGSRRRRSGKTKRDAARDYSDWVVRSGLFDLALASVTIYMAFKARRFIPLATVTVVPIMVAMLTDVFGRAKQLILGRRVGLWSPTWQHGLAGLNAGLLLVGGVMAYIHIVRPYRDPNPVYPKQTVLMRMVGGQSFPEQAMTFLNAQEEIAPETFVDWRWEGYTRWRTDRLKTFCGGRAQQVHSERIAKWQITVPREGSGPLRITRTRDGLMLDNGKVAGIFARKDDWLAQLRLGQTPLALITAAITVRENGKDVRYEADRNVGARFAERTEVWTDLDVALERTAEPKFRAEYTVTMMGDQPYASHQTGICRIQLKRLTNTGQRSYRVVSHSLLTKSLQSSYRGPFAEKPIAYWQGKDLRFGLTVSRAGRMRPRVDRSEKPFRIESVCPIGEELDPKQSGVAKNADCLVFVSRVQPNYPMKGTYNLVRHLEVRNCRRVVDLADEHGVKVFVMCKKDWQLAWLLMRSKRWACVFDDGAACVLLNRGDPRNQKVIKNILAGKGNYPNPFLEAVGKALTRRSVAPADADVGQFQRDLMSAVDIEPKWVAYWWLMQIRRLFPQANKPERLKENMAFWKDQWKALTTGPIDPQRSIRVYQSQQIAAQMLYDSCRRLRLKDEAEKWKQRAKGLHEKMTFLRETYM